jgi:LemA protein
MIGAGVFRVLPRIVLILPLLVTLAGCGKVNEIPQLDEAVKAAWSQVLNQYQRRTDLVPNLVETVKAYAAHERGVFEEVAAKRASSIAADSVTGQASAEQALRGALGRLFAIAEAYPELKANKNFLDLQQQLATIEDQLQMARRYYNGSVRNLNISIQSFPNNLMAGVLGFHPEPFFELEDRASGAAPTVTFAQDKP